MSIVSIVQEFPTDLQPSMFRLMEALDRDLREKYAVRRDDFDELRATVQSLAEAQRRTEVRLEELAEAQRRTEVRLEELAEAQRHTEARLEELAEAQRRTEERLEELAKAQELTSLQLGELAERMQQMTQRLDGVDNRLDGIDNRLDGIDSRLDGIDSRLDRIDNSLAKTTGWRLEQSYREKAHAYFGRVLRRVNVVSFQEIEDKVEELPPSERDTILLLDLIVRGRPRGMEDAPEVHLAVEISAVIDRNDVGRAIQRAAILRSLGYIVTPVVAGEKVTKGGLASAQEDHVALFQNGKTLYWDEALRHALASA